MWYNGRWYTDPEMQAYVDGLMSKIIELETENAELKGKDEEGRERNRHLHLRPRIRWKRPVIDTGILTIGI